MKVMVRHSIQVIALVSLALTPIIPVRVAGAAVMNDYINIPPFISQPVPPLVMFVVGRDHKLYFNAYNDAADLDDDGQLETGYKHSIDYYGYFDSHKCYTHSGGSGNSDTFTPVNYTADKFCASGQWSGNVLNWMTMSRMDVLKKVLFGGHRSQDSNTLTQLERVYIPQDAHSWGKELTGRLCYDGTTYTTTCVDASDCNSASSCVDKSTNLIGFAAADAPTECSSPVTVNWNTSNKILITKYQHPNHTGVCGNYSVVAGSPAYVGDPGPYESVITDTVYSSYEVSPSNFLDYYYISDFNVNDSGNKDALPTKDHGDNYNMFAVTEFSVANSDSGTWQFFLDSDDGSELLIDGQIVTTYGDCHSACFSGTPPASITATTACTINTGNIAPLPGTISLTSGWHRLMVRQSEASGQDGIKVWYKKKGYNSSTAWTIFGSTLTLRAPNISSSNSCSLQSQAFIDSGTPVNGTAKRHLFCNTTLSDGGTPIVRVLKNMTNRIWEWSAKERPVCDTSLGTPSDYAVRVEVCNSTVGIEDNCKDYSGTKKPTGLLQRYGEGDGSKLCSKAFSKTCTTDSDCGTGEGLCIYKAPMYFGLLTGSYTKNQSGGVLRKNIGTILDETNANNGIFQTSENVQGNIMMTLDRMKIIDYDYSDHSYHNCGWYETGPPPEGMCRMWGNPLAEMMYESLRYFAGKGSPLSEFTYSGSQDAGLSLSKPSWGYSKGSTTYQIYDTYPSCAKPFMLLLSDINPSYDSDQVPGTSFGSYSEDSATPQLNMNVSTLANTIGTQEAIAGNNWFIGQTTTLNDFICSAKTVSNLSIIRGLCPEEPTKKGSYYAAAVAYYGKTQFKTNTGKPNVTTFSVALASPVANLKIKVGSNFITFVPTGKSLDGCLDVNTYCASKCTFTTDSAGRFISSCSSDAFCPTNQIVNYFLQNVKYDSSNNIIYAKFSINYEDSEQGADFDMDAIVSYELCTAASYNMDGTSCNNSSLASNQLEVKLSSDYASGCIDQALGFVISGTGSADGTYLPLKDRDVPNTSEIAGLGLSWQHTFTASSTGSTSNFLKDPLWYAAKWGGFTDTNGNNKPDLLSEWNKDGNGDPDNYFLAVNPLKLEQQLNKALNDILTRVSSGTAASILNNSEGSGANLLQAVFYPKKDFDDSSATWIGEMQNLWYYLDPYLNKSTIREDSIRTDLGDTTQDNILNLRKDYVAQFYFNGTQTLVQRFEDTNGDGAADVAIDTILPDQVNSLWKAGKQLWNRNLATDPRTIYTTDGSSLISFSTTNDTALRPSLQAADNTETDKIINYVRGTDQTGYRTRQVTINGTTSEWRLGDIISSTPKLESTMRLNAYNLKSPNGYNDSSYGSLTGSCSSTSTPSYSCSSNYKNRGMVFVGSNDGMLHAFKLGILDVSPRTNISEKAQLTGTNLGREQWSFIPKNALPYLKYLADPVYNHIYYVDNTTALADVSIHNFVSTPALANCSAAQYWNCERKTTYQSSTTNLDLANTSWRTVLIGGMGFGGASRNSTGSCASTTSTIPDCVKTPIAGLGYSSYFALDVTDPENPSFMWEFTGSGSLGYSTTGPAIVRVGDKTTNGRWFAIFGSGPTGPINTVTHQFLGRSDQNLQLFVVDIATGTLVRTIDTGVTNAFASSLTTSVIDTDRSNPSSPGFYNDDAMYIGYVQKDTSLTPATWTKGGVLRLLTKENTDPTQWAVSTVINNIGPVTSSITKLQDRLAKNGTTGGARGKLWLYFGTGRYFFKDDDNSTQRRLYGVMEPCYSRNTGSPSFSLLGPENDMDTSCTSSAGSLTDQTSSPTATIPDSSSGWYINLDTAALNDGFMSERVITDPLAMSNGAVFFTTFRPTSDICGYGGNSYIWAVKYDTGSQPPAASLQSKALMQVSTGSFAEIKLSTAFTAKNNRRLGTAIQGVPPTKQGLAIPPKPQPVKKILQIQEK